MYCTAVLHCTVFGLISAGRCYVMKRDKLQTDQHLEKMIDNWKLREGPSNSILLLNGLVHLEVNWFLESTDLMKTSH